jgi:hypothetical protein
MTGPTADPAAHPRTPHAPHASLTERNETVA